LAIDGQARGLTDALDVNVVGHLVNVRGAVLRVILVVVSLGLFGIQMASFAAGLFLTIFRSSTGAMSRKKMG
jgi:hypothetical protein